jgi:hypothetical protein
VFRSDFGYQHKSVAVQPDPLDDMRDQWRAVHHEPERIRVIQWLQKFAVEKSVRCANETPLPTLTYLSCQGDHPDW